MSFAQFQQELFYKELSQNLSDKNFQIKELTQDSQLHYKQSIKETLSCLTSVGNLSNETFLSVTTQWIENRNIYKPVTIIEKESNKVVAIGTLMVERKLIHDGGKVGHIEDIAVHDNYQGKGLGKILIELLKNLAVLEGCYKVILDCDEKNVSFYNKCGFKRCGVEMEYRP